MYIVRANHFSITNITHIILMVVHDRQYRKLAINFVWTHKINTKWTNKIFYHSLTDEREKKKTEKVNCSI